MARTLSDSALLFPSRVWCKERFQQYDLFLVGWFFSRRNRSLTIYVRVKEDVVATSDTQTAHAHKEKGSNKWLTPSRNPRCLYDQGTGVRKDYNGGPTLYWLCRTNITRVMFSRGFMVKPLHGLLVALRGEPPGGRRFEASTLLMTEASFSGAGI